MAPHLSSTDQIQSQSSCILVQKLYLLGAASIPENTFLPDAHAIPLPFNRFSNS